MKIAVYPGSFDPITNGHLDIIKRASKLFDIIYVIIAKNSAKNNFFNDDERLEMVQKSLVNYDNVKILLTDELVVNVAKNLNAVAIIRGIRAITDFEYEFQLAACNEFLNSSIETIFLSASEGMSFISSSNIKEFVKHGVDVSKLVPTCVIEAFERKNK